MKHPLLLVLPVTLLALGCGDSGSSGDQGGGNGSGGDTSASGTSASGTPTSGSTGTGSTTSTSTGTTTTSASTGSGMDPYAAARTLCINKINELRATKNLPAYAQWTTAETCADQQATSDEAAMDAHGAFQMCGEFGQNECLGAGVNGIESCLQSMWDERLQAGCAGCDACNGAYDPSCPNCDFDGQSTGDVCGHYVNMSALYFSKAACGFSAGGGWDVIDFQ